MTDRIEARERSLDADLASDGAGTTDVYANPETKRVAYEKSQSLKDQLMAIKGFPVRGGLDINGSAHAAAQGKEVVMGAIAKASVDAMHRAAQGKGPRQSGR